MNEIHALSGAYAVDALDDVERTRFERHLAGCGACRREVAELREVTAALAQSVAAEPTPALRGSILDAIAETPQDSGATVRRHRSPRRRARRRATGCGGRRRSACPGPGPSRPRSGRAARAGPRRGR